MSGGRIKRKNPTKSFFLLKKDDEPDFGFTTGTCAAAASIAAAKMLLWEEEVSYVILTTPRGIKVCIEIESPAFSKKEAAACVQKFSGSDPDVTNGIKVWSKVTKIPGEKKEKPLINIDGGLGVGRVTLPGLPQKIGQAAINPVPRQMIFDGLISEIDFYKKEKGIKEFDFDLSVEISIPQGLEKAKETFNPKLGIVGGISVLGTSGIVEPMSEKALVETIALEIKVRKAQGFEILPLVPGNYGADFMQSEFNFSLSTSVHSSNFIYDSIELAKKAAFKKILFCGHLGKLVKVAGGVKNTHSRYGDRRMEIISNIAKNYNDSNELAEKLLSCVTSEEAVKVLDSYGIKEKVMEEIALKIKGQMEEWSLGCIQVEVIVFTKEMGLLAMTGQARDFMEKIKKYKK